MCQDHRRHGEHESLVNFDIEETLEDLEAHWPRDEQLDEYLAMTDPVACSACGRISESTDVTYFTELCNCSIEDDASCPHGVCAECCEAIG